MEGATSYEADIAESPAVERIRVRTEETSYRWESLNPDSDFVIWVRAVTETAGGRAVGEWSTRAFTWTLPLSSGPHRCTNEREMVLRYGSQVASDWNPGRPFRFNLDEVALRQCGESLGLPDWYETEIVGRLASAQADFEARLGYAIFEAVPAEDGPGVITITVLPRGGDAQEECARANAYARPEDGLLFFSLGYCDLACRPPREVGWQLEPTVSTGTVIHELGHILGMRHHDRGDPDDLDALNPYGLEMSHELDGVFQAPRHFTDYDIDRLACAYPAEP